MSETLQSVEEYKTRAQILLKALRSGDDARVNDAAKRFVQYAPLARFTAAQLTSADAHVQLKHALAVVALEAGYDSWSALKQAAENTVSATTDRTERLCPRNPGGFLNSWFRTHEEAQECLQKHGGFLLPYRTQFFVCTADYIRDALHLDPAHEDWAKIGNDWAKPRDRAAWQRLSDALDELQ